MTTTENISEIVRRLGKALDIAEGLEPQMSDPFHCAVARVRAVVAELDGLGVPPDPRPDRLGWLEPDFVALYTAAAATIDISTLSQTRAVRAALLAQLDRLRPAFDTLKRELEQREARLDALANAARARAEKSPVENLIHKLGQVVAIDTSMPEAGHDCGATVEGPMPYAITAAIIDDPVHVDAADVAVAGTWIAYAMRGAAMGWHAAHAHPNDVAGICRTVAASLDEPHRAAWEHGYRLAADFAGQLKAAAAAPIADGEYVPTIHGPGDDEFAAADEARARAELGRRGLDLDAMNRGRVAGGLDQITAVEAVDRLDGAQRAIDITTGNIPALRRCRACGCTDDDCSQCVAKTGEPCSWVEADLCSACAEHDPETQL